MNVFVSNGNRFQALKIDEDKNTKDLTKEIVKAGIHKALYTFSLYFQNHQLKDGTLKSEGITDRSLIITRPTLTSSIDLQFRMSENGDTLIFEVFPFDTISSIKEKFFEKSNLDEEKNLLLLNGDVLNSYDDDKLEDHMLRASDVIFVALQPEDLPKKNIIVYITLGNDLLLQTFIQEDKTINDLKDKIASVYQIPADNQNLFWNSRVQEDDKTINSCSLDKNYAVFTLELSGDLEVTILQDSKEITQSFDAFSTIKDVKKALFKPNGIKKNSDLLFEGITCNDSDVLFSFYRIQPKFTVEGTVDQDALDRVNDVIKSKADDEDPSYTYIYAKMAYFGIVVEQDKKQAAAYFRKAAELHHYSAMTDYAELMYLGELPEKKEGKALEYAKEAAENGHVGAQYLYGIMCLKNNENEEAQKYLNKASDKGHLIASTTYAYMIIKGKSEITDKSVASELLEEAARKKYTPAMILLSKLLKKNKNRKEALKLIKEAAELNSPNGLYSYAKEAIMDDGDLEKAAKIAQKGADLGHSKSKRILGIMKRRGTGTEKDDQNAFKLLTESTNAGDTQAKFHLAKMYLTGSDACKKDEKKAFQLVCESAEKEHPPSVLLKANMLLRGIGTKKKPKEAYKTASDLAQKTGYIPCLRLVGVCQYLGLGTNKDLESASKCLLRAAETDTIAQYYYAMLLKGLSRYPQNRDEVASYLQKAADKNHHDAEEQLGLLLLERELPDSPKGASSDETKALINDKTYEQNKRKALKYFTKAADAGKIESMYQEAVLLLGYNEQEEKAVKLIEKTVEANHARGFYQYSILLEEGRGIEKDLPKSREYLQKAADMNVPEAQYKLGMKLYEEGKVSDAILYLRKAADAGIVEAMVDLAKILQKEDEETYHDEIISLLEKASKLGNIEASLMCGDIYYNQEKYYDAFNMYKKAALKENTEGMFKYARMIEEGQGTIVDPQNAVKYYQKCVDLQHIPSMYYLGRCYEKGNGVEQDYEKAFDLYQRSADNQNADGMYGLGKLYKNGLGVDDDEDKAFEYFTKASELDHVEGNYELGLMYEEGKGTDVDKSKAYEHFKFSSDHGYGPAMVYHAHDLLHGIGVEKDMDEGRKVLLKAVELKQRDAYFEYAELLDFEKNKEESEKYYKLCADLGNVQGMICTAFNLVKQYEESVDKDKEVTPEELQENELLRKAAHYFELAADEGDPVACCNYGLCLAKGAGVTRDERMAIKYMRKGVSSNYKDAIFDSGVFLEKAKGETRALQESRRLLKIASDAGSLIATYNLGVSLIENEPKEIENGLELIKKAADNGIDQAVTPFAFYKFTEKIEECENDENGDTNYQDDEDFKLIAQYAKRGADDGNIEAMSLYGTLLSNGFGVAPNEREAAEYFKKAADGGNSDAMYNYGMMLLNGIGVEKDQNMGGQYLVNALKNGRDDVEPILYQNKITY
ncbi:hypothetical protein M9Y10_005016 [Tritrichomonas musculus]|uniref:Ubiquitin-like domain-containing protein n=1 Tax=Tritrichomonas musculus TaxID=1915356 RepID=A0ABR2JK37_9EUKA